MSILFETSISNVFSQNAVVGGCWRWNDLRVGKRETSEDDAFTVSSSVSGENLQNFQA